MIEKKSIYEEIVKAREDQPSLPYPFQNPHLAGREDTLFILLTEGIPFSRKEDLACECCRIISETIAEQETPLCIKKITDFLDEHPLRLFFIEFRERLRVLLDQNFYDEKKLYSLAIDLARGSSQPEEVKLGILILGFFPHDLTLQLFKTLGYHSDYTIFVAESLRHSHFQQNQFIFDLAQHTVGYGKLAALFLLKPVTEEQQKWVLEEGVKSSFLSSVYTSISFQKTDVREYLFQLEITEDNYQDLMYFLAYREPDTEEIMLEDMLSFMERLAERKNFARSFIDQAGLVMIWHQIIENWKQDYEDLDGEAGLEEETEISEYWEKRFERYENLIRSIEIFLNQPKWNMTAGQELAEPTESDFLIVTVLQFLEMKPELSAFSSVLRRNPLGFHLLDFFLENHAAFYFESICSYLQELLNEELFLIPLEFKETDQPESDDLFRVGVWLETLFKLMVEKDFYDEGWLLRGIHYYQPKIRRLSLQALIKNQAIWGIEVLPQLLLLEKEEKNRKNYLLLRRMLHPDEENEKERKYMSVSDPVKETSFTDRKLLDSYIAGTRHYDLSVAEAIVKPDMILQLVREKENEYDRYAVAVTLENGYLLGYLPRVDNRVFANLLENDEQLYALLKSTDLEEPEPPIAIMIKQKETKNFRKKETAGKNVVPFPNSKKE